MEILILTVPTSFSFCFKSYFAILIFFSGDDRNLFSKNNLIKLINKISFSLGDCKMLELF